MNWSWAALERPDATLWCRDTGGQGPALLLLHGLAGHGGEWNGVAERLADRYRVLAPDQRGHGPSTRRPPDLSRDAFVDDVVAVIKQLNEEQPVILMGQSMGAHTAMLTAAARPQLVERLIMVGGVGGGGSEVARAVGSRLRSWPVPFTSPEAALAYFGGDGPVGRAWVAGLEQRSDGLWPRFDPDVMELSLRYVTARPFWNDWARTSQPTLLVVGEGGIIDRDEVGHMVTVRGDVNTVVIPGAGHDVHLEQPSLLVAALADFLAGPTTASSAGSL